MRRLLPMVIVPVLVLVAATTLASGSAFADRSNDQQIADNSVLTADDVPGFTAVASDDTATPDTPECRGVARARHQLETAPNRAVEFRTPNQDQVVQNKVAVLASTKRAKQVLRTYRSARARACLVTAFTDGIRSQDPAVQVSVDVSPVPLDVGDEAVEYQVRATATKAGASQNLFTTVGVARVGRAIVSNGLADATGPVPQDVAGGLIELVTQRLQEAL